MSRRALIVAVVSASLGIAGVVAAPPASAEQLVVNSTDDTVDGSCDAGPGGCTLRDAFAVADGNGEDDEIILQAGATYSLTDAGEGDLDHADAHALTITGNGATIVQTVAGERVIHQSGAGALLTVDGLTITGGSLVGGDDGGGINALGPVVLRASTVAGNSAGSGAGVYAINGTVSAEASTFSGNTAEDVGGGIFSGGNGAAITLVNSTVTGNHADEGGGVSTSGAFGEITITLRYATVVGNSALAGANVEGEGLTSFGSVIALGSGGGQDCFVSGPLESTGWSADGDGSCGFGAGPGDQPAAGDPDLAPLAANGGPTLTRLPLTGSPLLDAIPVADCQADGAAGITTDQRGVTRPQLGGCDIGAVEVEASTPELDPNFTG